MKNRGRRPVLLLTAAQGLGAAAIAALCLALTALPGAQGSILMKGCLMGVSVCAAWTVVEMICLCSRVKQETAFTRRNVHALGRCCLLCCISALLLLPIGHDVMAPFLGYMPLQGLIPSFAAVTVALMLRAVQLLLGRAAEMQTESDLTV